MTDYDYDFIPESGGGGSSCRRRGRPWPDRRGCRPAGRQGVSSLGTERRRGPGSAGTCSPPAPQPPSTRPAGSSSASGWSACRRRGRGTRPTPGQSSGSDWGRGKAWETERWRVGWGWFSTSPAWTLSSVYPCWPRYSPEFLQALA